MKTSEIIAVTAVVYTITTMGLYYGLRIIGIDAIESMVESIVIATTLITLLILFLLGAKWREELELVL